MSNVFGKFFLIVEVIEATEAVEAAEVIRLLRFLMPGKSLNI